jgi:hypothetical protein
VADVLGFKKACPRTREVVQGSLKAAVLRGILENEQGMLYIYCRNIDDYRRDFLKKILLSVMRSKWWERDKVIRAAAHYLGFAKAGSRIQKAFASAITGLIRQGQVERDGAYIRRV